MTVKKINGLTAAAALTAALVVAGLSFGAGAASHSAHHHHQLGLDRPIAAPVEGQASGRQVEIQADKDFYGEMEPEDQAYATSVCNLQYKYRTDSEKQYCADIGQ